MPFSASRISTWMRCPSRAAWQYIGGYEEEDTDATGLGTEVHNELERIKKTPGAVPDRTTVAGQLADAALPYVQDLSLGVDGCQIEGEFTFQGRHLWRGKIDIEKPGDLRDYKTTSDFKWAKTPEALLGDPQAVLYAERMFRRLEAGNGPLAPDATVQGTWLYIRKRKPYQVKPVVFTMTREHARRGFEALESYADEMQTAAYDAPADPAGKHNFILTMIDKNPEACNDFHRQCPHFDRCGMSFFHDPSNPRIQGKTTMGLFERLAEQNQVAATPPPVPPRPTLEPPAMATGLPCIVTKSPEFLAGFGPAGPAALAAVQAVGQALAAAAPRPPSVPPPLPAVAVAPGQVNPPKRGPGRPPGAKNKTTVAAASAELAESLQATAPDTIPAPPPVPSVAPPAPVAQVAQPVTNEAPVAAAPATGHRIEMLFVGCLPRTTTPGNAPTFLDFDTLVAQCKIAIGPAQYFKDYGYKSNGHLLSMVEAQIQHAKPEAVVVISPLSPEAVLCLSHLRSISDIVVEGLR